MRMRKPDATQARARVAGNTDAILARYAALLCTNPPTLHADLLLRMDTMQPFDRSVPMTAQWVAMVEEMHLSAQQVRGGGGVWGRVGGAGQSRATVTRSCCAPVTRSCCAAT